MRASYSGSTKSYQTASSHGSQNFVSASMNDEGFAEAAAFLEEEAKHLITLVFAHEPLPDDMTYETASRILKDYHKLCFAQGEYENCELGKKAILLMKFQNEKRHIDNIKRIQMKEREAIDMAFEQELSDVTEMWEEKLSNLQISFEDQRRRLLERHQRELEDFQEKFFEDIKKKYYPKSRDLITLRTMEETLARQEFYFEAISVKKKAEKLEEEEFRKLMIKHSDSFDKKKANFIKKQQQDIVSLDIRLRREKAENIKQRDRDIEQVMYRYSNLKMTAQSHHSQFESKARSSLLKSNTSLISSLKGSASADVRDSRSFNVSADVREGVEKKNRPKYLSPLKSRGAKRR